MMQNLASLDLTNLSDIFKITKAELYSYINEAAISGKHNEFYNLAKNLSLDVQNVCCTVSRCLVEQTPNQFAQVIDTIKHLLP